jgi:two-component system phosphate regulon response regulator PhoB
LIDGMTAALNEVARVLIVDDELDLQGLLVHNLREAGFVAEAVGTGKDALLAASRSHPDVIVLDLMLPDMLGTEVSRRVRADPDLCDVGILMLSARGDEYDRVHGFEAGADDYVVKPFSVRELMMRVAALAPRAHERRIARGAASERRLQWNGILMDLVGHRVYLDGVERPLRPLEFKLLSAFLEQPGRTLSREDLLEQVWEVTGAQSTRTVDVHIRRLRERLGENGSAIETVLGSGYRLRSEGS